MSARKPRPIGNYDVKRGEIFYDIRFKYEYPTGVLTSYMINAVNMNS